MEQRPARDGTTPTQAVRRGTVVWVDLSDAHPPELGKVRPAVVVSNSDQNAVLTSLVVVPLSSRAPAIWPLRIALPAIGALRQSFAVTPGIRQIASDRVQRTKGHAPTDVMAALDDAIAAYLTD